MNKNSFQETILKLVLIILFYSLFTPIGLIMSLFKVDLLDRRINKYKNSYWRIKQKNSFSKSDAKGV
ncbi:MAG: hypothetical protein HZC15_07020 [Candidatus Omnitrophica bacterium]|jgi:hypothetical protein|nr:hypothetical protein [Candidatus Omnitrophota bacterium]